MLTQKRVFECIRPLNWFAAIDLKEARFHVSILPQHWAFLRFVFEDRACQYQLLPFGHLSQLGFRVNWGKSKLVPMQRISFSQHGGRFGQPDRTSHPETCSVGAELPQDFIRQDGGPTETHSEAPGAYICSRGDSSAWLMPQDWLYGRVPRWAWQRGTHRIQITPACRRTFSPWTDPSFLQAGVPLE